MICKNWREQEFWRLREREREREKQRVRESDSVCVKESGRE